MDSRTVRDSAFESVDVDDNESETAPNDSDNTSLDRLEQQQAREQARLLHRFRELRQWQQQQQDQLMQQQHLQLEMLKGEQMRIQTLVASQRGAQWGEGKVTRPEAVGRSPPLMTPPRRTVVGGELARTMMAMPHASADSGLVASLGDTLEQPKDSLPKPIMYPTSPQADEDRYTNPELFSNPGSYGDDLQAVDDCFPLPDSGSEVGSDNFYLPPPPPEPRVSQTDMQSSLKTLQALMGNSAPDFLQQMLGLLPSHQKSFLLEQRQAAVQESASPTFSPVNSLPVHHSLPSTRLTAQAPPSSVSSQPSQLVRTSADLTLKQTHKPQDLRSQGAQFSHSSQTAQFPPSSASHPLNLNSKSAQFPTSLQSGHYLASGGEENSRQLSRSQNSDHGVPGMPHTFLHSAPVNHQQLDQLERHLVQQQLYLQHSQHLSQQEIAQQRLSSQHEMAQQRLASQAPSQHQSHFRQSQSQPEPPQQSHTLLYTQASSQMSNGRPFERPVKVRTSWEEVESEGERGMQERGRPRKEQASSQHRQEEVMDAGDTEDEEEEEELEVTIKHAPNSPEDRPIRPGKTFEQLLEEQLADEEKRIKEEHRKEKERQQTSSSTKRPFLRKGQGIARFSQPIKRPPPRRPAAGGHKSSDTPRETTASRTSGGVDTEKAVGLAKPPVRSQPERKRLSGGRKKVEDDPLQPEKLKLIKRKSETGKKMQQASKVQASLQPTTWLTVNGDQSETQDEKDSIADDASFVAALHETEKKVPLEAEELDEFEALEDIADNMSLVSDSSVVKRLVTPNKVRQKNAVSDLKAVLEKKKNLSSSPFERNAAIRSLLSVNVPNNHHPAPSSTWSPELKRPGIKNSDDSLSDDSADSDLDLNNEDHTSNCDVRTERNRTDVDPSVEKQLCIMKGVGVDEQTLLPGMNGINFSHQFKLFDQHGGHLSLGGHTSQGLSDGSEGAGFLPPSPTKSVTRKVATLQSRLNAANDTASLLQKLSAQAGFLSGFVPSDKREAGGGVMNGDNNESATDGSPLSTSVSRPQPVVIGGKRESRSRNDFVTDNTRDVRKGSCEESEESDENTIEDIDDDDDDEKSSDENFDFGGKVGQEKISCVPSGSGDGGAIATENGNSNNNSNKAGGLDFDDEEEWVSTAPKASSALATNQPESGVQEESTPPTSKLMSRLFPKLKAQTASQQQHQQKMQMASSTSVGDGIQSKLLREKLAELEAEIEKFRTENAALDRLRRDREEGVNKLKEEIARFDQEKTNELKRLEEFKAQETKKLKNDRKLFEAYQKQVRSMPDKKDREEIESLKRQLGDLQDEMKRKESRWTSTVTRLKTRITELEGENAEMREEMKMFERKRLEWMQTRGPNKPAQPQQQMSSAKTAPRSSTPTNITAATTTAPATTMNGIHDNTAAAMNGSRFRDPPRGAAMATTQLNGAGAAGKAGIGGHGGHGESMPRDQPATPSMIEGVSPAAMTESGAGEGSASFMAEMSASRPSLDRPTVDKGSGQYEETQYSDGKVERVYTNGSREVLFANGTRKEISSDGQYFIVAFFNGDIKQVFPDQRVVYYYAESQTTHTTYPDRLEVLQFPNNQIEKHYPDGTHEITFPNQTVKYLFPNGTEESIFPDGTILRIDKNGERILEFPNGQREIHTQEHKRREYPDGTVKTLHNDGRQETRYSTGRVRLKDKDGNVLLDRMY